MYYSDYHMHTQQSSDSHATLVGLGRTAVTLGIQEICITDHWNLVNQRGELLPHTFDWAAAKAQIADGKKFFGDSLNIRLGVEIGNGELNHRAVAEQIAISGADFIIGSIHNSSAKLNSLGIYTTATACTSETECRAVMEDYCDTLETLVKTDGYDVLGHIIYPLRYFPKKLQASFAPHWEQLTEILKIIIASGKGIEINTSQGTTIQDWRPYLALYRSLGGEILTTGADAHYDDKAGAGIHDAVELITGYGFEYICTYRNRVPQFQKIK